MAGHKVLLRLQPAVRNRRPVEVSLDGAGGFNLYGLTPGRYELVIAKSGGRPIERRSVEIHTDRLLDIDLRMPAPAPQSHVLSARRLGRHVSLAAKREFSHAVNAWQKGDLLEAENGFAKAVALEPAFTEALNNLAVLYLRRNDPAHAEPLIRAALESDPHSADVYVNAAAVASIAQNLEEAASFARHAISLDPSSSAARFLLGRTLTIQERELPEALFHLRRSSQDYPDSMLYIGQILFRAGQAQQAMDEIRSYLARSDSEQSEMARAILSAMERSRNKGDR
jgi:tetratricopeptide (TPR) repeat protein